MISVLALPLLVLLLYRIADYDLKTHLIRDLDLILLFILLNLLLHLNWKIGVLYSLVLLSLNILTKGAIGFGDIKLALVLGSAMSTALQLVISINIAWIIGGVWALISKRKSIPFAPAIIFGAVVGQLTIGLR